MAADATIGSSRPGRGQRDGGHVVGEGPPQVLPDSPQGPPRQIHRRNRQDRVAGHQRHVGGLDGEVAAGSHAHTHRGGGQGRGVVHAVTDEGGGVPFLLPGGDDAGLVPGSQPGVHLGDPQLAGHRPGGVLVVACQHGRPQRAPGSGRRRRPAASGRGVSVTRRHPAHLPFPGAGEGGWRPVGGPPRRRALHRASMVIPPVGHELRSAHGDQRAFDHALGAHSREEGHIGDLTGRHPPAGAPRSRPPAPADGRFPPSTPATRDRNRGSSLSYMGEGHPAGGQGARLV